MRGSPVQVRHGPLYNILMPIRYPVPFFSQYSDIKSHLWQYRGCGIVALKMILDFWHKNNKDLPSPAVENLLKEGLTAGAYIKDIGWSHSGLVEIGKKFGYSGYNKDLAHIPVQEAWEEFNNDLKKYPIMASVYKRLNPKTNAGHIVVITGIDDSNLYLNDPLEGNEERGRQVIPIQQFIDGWKQRYIVVHPR